MTLPTDFSKSYRCASVLLLFCVFFITSCIPPEPTVREPFYNITRLVVLPFSDMSDLFGEGAHVKCPLCGQYCIPERVPPETDTELTIQLIAALQNHGSYDIIRPEQIGGMLSEHTAKNKKSLLDKNLLIRIGQQVYADAIITGHVYRFRERVGNQYAVDSPASVGLDIHLIHVSSGKVIWTSRFDETQQSLGENLFQLGAFLRRNMKWVTATELAASGIEDAIREMPVR